MTPTSAHSVNSTRYWDERFRTDWDAYSGREQTRFFARVALDHLPGWLDQDIRRNDLSICDWGCAEGDGVDALACHFDVTVTGVDFSQEAIDKATAFYPAHPFVCADFLQAEEGERFDLVFSSNTVEHFARPWEVFDRISARARRYVVLLVPFREHERHVEHFYTFDYPNVPIHRAGFELVEATVIDTSTATPSYWPGEQLLLVYARTALAPGLALSLAGGGRDAPRHAQLGAALKALRDAEGEAATRAEEAWRLEREQLQAEHRAAQEAAEAHLALRAAELESMRAQLEQSSAVSASLQADLYEAQRFADERAARTTQCEAEKRNLEARAREQEALLAEILGSNSWRLTRPLRAVRRLFG